MTGWLIFCLLFLTPVLALIRLGTPAGNFTAGGQVSLTWTFDAADPIEFILGIRGSGQALKLDPGLTTNRGNASVTLPSTLPTGQYTFVALNSSNTDQDPFSSTSTFSVTGVSGSTTTPSTTPTSPPSESPSSKSNIAPIVGGAVGGVVVIILVCFGFYYYRRRTRRVTPSKAPPSEFLSNLAGPDPPLPPPVPSPATRSAKVPIPPTETSLLSRSNSSRPPPSTNPPTSYTPSASSSSPPRRKKKTSRSGKSIPYNRQLSSEQNEFIHDLYKRNVPSSVIADIINRFLQGDSTAGSEHRAETSTAVSIASEVPPRYDQLT